MSGNRRPEDRGVTFFERWEDEFGTLNANGTRNVLDIASQYNFSPERLRLFRNGSREFPQYNSVTQFNDAETVYELQPDAGDTIHIETAESSTYVVNYIMQASFAFAVNQSLTDGDSVRIGPYNGTDGWFMEQRGADHTDKQVDIIEAKGGTETTLVSDVDLQRPITHWNRYECRYNWYNVGNQVWRQTYTEDGEQRNPIIAKSSRDGTRGPDTGNLNLYQEVTADASTSNLQLDVGSMGMIVLGDPTSLNRDKPQFVSISSAISSADTWTPVYAIRIDPGDSDVNCQLSQVDVLDYGNATVEMVVVSVDPSKTDATGWGDPGYHHADNSAMQSTTNISQVPDTTGTQTTLGASDKFGGFTLGSAVDVDGGNASGSAATQNQATVQKKSVLNSDEVVFLARSSSTGNTLSFVWDVDQNW